MHLALIGVKYSSQYNVIYYTYLYPKDWDLIVFPNAFPPQILYTRGLMPGNLTLCVKCQLPSDVKCLSSQAKTAISFIDFLWPTTITKIDEDFKHANIISLRVSLILVVQYILLYSSHNCSISLTFFEHVLFTNILKNTTKRETINNFSCLAFLYWDGIRIVFCQQ